ncbi:hypothetical protein WUBG_03360, partial [Wuchereria bancrofti]
MLIDVAAAAAAASASAAAAAAALSSTRGRGKDCQAKGSIKRIPSRSWLHFTFCKRFHLARVYGGFK